MKAATSIFGTFVGLVLFCFVAGAQTHSDLEVESMQRASSERIEELSIQLHNIKAEKSARLAPLKDVSRIAVPSQSARSAMGLQTFALRGAIDCGRPPEQTCAQNCTSRYTNGTCASYGADVCN